MRASALVTAAVAACLTPAAVLAASAERPAGARAMASAYNATGRLVMRTFAQQPGNIVFSPLSLGSALNMATHGARGTTHAEMDRVLSTAGLPGGDARELMRVFDSYDTSATPPQCPPAAKLVGDECAVPAPQDGRCPMSAQSSDGQCLTPARRAPSAQIAIANALMILKDVAPSYVADLERDYDAEVFRKANLATINGWVASKTKGHVDKILDQLGPNDIAVILNAAYFRARWANVFAKGRTNDAPFWSSRDQSVPVKTMHQTARFAVVTGDGFRAIRLPYTVGQLAMVVVLPDAKDGVDAIGAALDAAALARLAKALETGPPRQVALALPKFKVDYDASVIPALMNAGLHLPFGDKADFSGMTGQGGAPVYISQIRHRATIEVDEDGTEATAATAIVFSIRAAPPRAETPEPFVVDRPFLFYVTDTATGAILFEGRIAQPATS
ncbi:MAG TPA: serpin family protein [Xanthobacteraceae bacterium]|nr:serpin family protein [Xanthobacteraceae bacterium]